MTQANCELRYVAPPEGIPGPECFEVADVAMPEPGPGELLLREIYISLDPYMRSRMTGVTTYIDGFKLGAPCDGDVIAQVVVSNDGAFAAGDYVMGFLPWRNFAVSKAEGLAKVDPDAAPLSYYLGVLGMPGLTAFVGLLDIARPKAGESVFVSAAASTVGSLVGQIAKLKGCYVAGSAGSDEKVATCTESFGFDACINYKSAEPLADAVREICSKGIDICFENVGGPILDAALLNLNRGARIPLCGMIAEYNLSELMGARNLIMILDKRAKLQGYIVDDHNHRWDAFASAMGGWLAAGEIVYREHIVEGFGSLPEAFAGMFSGAHLGKSVVRIGPERT
jgi:NADPH-dependent curcumin reductase CurA